ncbi:MAG: DUF131 domain-containing protein [Methanomassiliicoccales archaeon]
MRVSRIIGPSLIFAGVLMLFVVVLVGEAEVGLLLIFPYIRASSWLGALAILLIFSGFISLFLSAWPGGDERISRDAVETSEKGALEEKGFGGIVLLGPIPIIFGSGSRAALLAMILMALMIMALIFFILFF